MQDAVAAEDVPELVRACGPAIAHHTDLLEDGTVGLRPVVEELGDHLVEILITGMLGLVDVVVDITEGHSLEDGLLGRPIAPPDEQCPAGGGEELASLREEL